MARFPDLGTSTIVPDILKKSPDAGVALMEVHEEVMRGDSPLSEGERPNSSPPMSTGLNQCRYCYGMHSRTRWLTDIPKRRYRVHSMISMDRSCKAAQAFAEIRAYREASRVRVDEDAKRVFRCRLERAGSP